MDEDFDRKCPRCGDLCDRESVDVGVGVIYGPYGCGCGWSEDPQYDRSSGTSPAQRENPGFYVDSKGGMVRVGAIADRCARFGIDPEVVRKAFGEAPGDGAPAARPRE